MLPSGTSDKKRVLKICSVLSKVQEEDEDFVEVPELLEYFDIGPEEANLIE